MHQETGLIALIAMAFVLAMALGYLALRLRLPPIVGYLLAGVAVGPFTPGFVGDTKLASQLAEIGVILLMFGVGLHFSIETLLKVRRIAIPGALVQIGTATAIGAGIASWWGWDLSAGLVFGLALSVASTVVLLRALTERNELDSENGRIAVGWLIIEDLVTVLALVFLPALASTAADVAHGEPSGNLALSLLITVGKVALFIALMLVGGKRVVPWMLGQVARTGSRELFTLAVLALALGIAFGSAVLFDVSFALGAFFAGVVLSESDLSHQAAADSLPLQDAFAVLFFVSVGMLFDPSILVNEPWAVLATLAIIVVGKSLAAFLIVLLFRYPVETALTVSAGLAQIGEFSFILAALGVELGLLPTEGRDLILAGALLSISLNAFVFATIRPVMRFIRSHRRLAAILDRPALRRPQESRSSHAHTQDHAVLIGHGRVGGLIGQALRSQCLPYVVIEKDFRLVESLRKQGVTAVYGDASTPGVLEAAGVDRAKLLIIASPDGFQARRILELALRRNSRLETTVRTHSESELKYLVSIGAGRAVMAEREVALGMTEYALLRLGLDEEKARTLLQQIRAS